MANLTRQEKLIILCTLVLAQAIMPTKHPFWEQFDDLCKAFADEVSEEQPRRQAGE